MAVWGSCAALQPLDLSACTAAHTNRPEECHREDELQPHQLRRLPAVPQHQMRQPPSHAHQRRHAGVSDRAAAAEVGPAGHRGATLAPAARAVCLAGCAPHSLSINSKGVQANLSPPLRGSSLGGTAAAAEHSQDRHRSSTRRISLTEWIKHVKYLMFDQVQ